MSIKITGRHIDVSESFRDSVESGISEATEKYNINPIETSVVISKNGHGFLSNISSYISRGLHLRSKCEGEDAYTAFHNSLDKLKHRISKHKEWVNHHHKHHDVHFEEIPYYVLDSQVTFDKQHEVKLSPAIIAETKKDLPNITVGEAVTRFDLSQDNAYVFRNAKNGAINIIYRRSDGNIGWVDPSM